MQSARQSRDQDQRRRERLAVADGFQECADLLRSNSNPSLRSLADLFDRFLQGQNGDTFEEVSGLCWPGEKSWRRLRDHEIADQALKAAETLISPPHFRLEMSERLKQLSGELRAYRRRRMSRDSRLEIMPAEYVGTVDAHFFVALKANQRLGRNDFPMSDSELRRLLSD
jgi:hypothetical protein